MENVLWLIMNITRSRLADKKDEFAYTYKYSS